MTSFSSSLPLSSFFSSPPITILPHFPTPISPPSSSVPTSNASSSPLTSHLFTSPPPLESSHVNRRYLYILTLTSHISPSTILLLIESQLRKVCLRGVLISSNYEGWRLSVVLVLDFDSFLLVWRCFVFSLFGSCGLPLFFSRVSFILCSTMFNSISPNPGQPAQLLPPHKPLLRPLPPPFPNPPLPFSVRPSPFTLHPLPQNIQSRTRSFLRFQSTSVHSTTSPPSRRLNVVSVRAEAWLIEWVGTYVLVVCAWRFYVFVKGKVWWVFGRGSGVVVMVVI